jgi:hypothetical protein
VRRPHLNARSVRKRKLGRRILDRRHSFTQPGRQPLIGKRDLGQLLLGVDQRVVDDAGGGVGIEQAGIELEQRDQRREAELTRFKDRVEIPRIVPIRALRFIPCEAYGASAFVLHPIEVV